MGGMELYLVNHERELHLSDTSAIILFSMLVANNYMGMKRHWRNNDPLPLIKWEATVHLYSLQKCNNCYHYHNISKVHRNTAI